MADQFPEELAQELRDDIAEIAAELRLEKGWTQRTAGSHMRTPQATISDIENGKYDVKMTTLQRLAYIYGYKLEVGFVPLEDG